MTLQRLRLTKSNVIPTGMHVYSLKSTRRSSTMLCLSLILSPTRRWPKLSRGPLDLESFINLYPIWHECQTWKKRVRFSLMMLSIDSWLVGFSCKGAWLLDPIKCYVFIMREESQHFYIKIYRFFFLSKGAKSL